MILSPNYKTMGRGEEARGEEEGEYTQSADMFAACSDPPGETAKTPLVSSNQQ